MYINEKLIFKADNIKTKEDLFNVIGQIIASDNRTTNEKNLVKDLISRESEGSTAFENGLMIPHARSKFVNEISIVVVNFEDVDFESLDGKKTNLAVSILVPEKESDTHLTILSKISSLFSDNKMLEKFRKASSSDKIKMIEDKVNEEVKVDNESEFDIVGVTACAAGIAHTYMARDNLLKAAKEMGYTIKIETRGAMTENRLSEKDIRNAKFVIIAADVTIPKSQFAGKKIYETDTNSAIKNSNDVIEQAKDAQVFYGKGQNLGKLRLGGTKKGKGNVLGKAIMSALSFMIPVTVAGGILMAIPNALAAGGNNEGGTWKFPNLFTEALWNFGHVGLLMMVPILSMFLAYKLGGKPAIPAALVGGYFINDGATMSKFSYISMPDDLAGSASAGFLGGLLVGIIVGYMVKLSKCIKWHPFLKPVSGLMIIPLLSSFLTFLIVVYIIGGPMTWIMAELFIGLQKLNEVGGVGASLGVGILFASLMAIDLGGPINKTALTVSTVIFTTTLGAANGDMDKVNFVPQTACQAAIGVPPLGMWFATIVFRKRFSISEIAAGSAALPMGLVGVTEGALPFAFKTPLKAIAANIVGSALAGGLVALFQIRFYGGLGSPLGAYVGYMENSYWGLLWLLATLSGAIVSGLLYGLMRKRVPEYEEALKKAKEEKLAEYKNLGYETKKEIRQYKNSEFRKRFKQRAKYMINPKNWFEKPDDWNEEETV